MTTNDLLAAALTHQKAGRIEQAASLYETILADAPDHADALHYSALITLRRGDAAAAIARLERAAAAAPQRAVVQNDLGAGLRLAGRLAEAKDALRRATELEPGYADAWNNLGIVLRAMSDYAGARAALERAAALKPDFPPTLNALGVVLKALGESRAAIGAFERAVGRKPDYVEALTNLGLALHELGDTAAALAPLRRAVELAPARGEPWLNLALAQRAGGDLKEALASLRRAVAASPGLGAAWIALGVVLGTLEERAEAYEALQRAALLEPHSVEALSNYGLSLHRMGRGEEAAPILDRALSIDPRHPEALFNRGVVRQAAGDFVGAEADWRSVLEIDPGQRLARSNVLFLQQYDPDMDGPALRAAADEFDRFHGSPKGRHLDWPNARVPERRLRIGYVSPDFREHSVAHYVEPLLAAHDRAAVEVFAYAELKRSDAMTERLKALAAHWRFTATLRDEDVAQRIRADGIDILVDLAGHSADSRLGVFALKPAPVQVTWLGFPGTTGLRAIDYRLTDAIADPPGTESHFSETLIRLPRGFHCWRPPAGAPAVMPRARAAAPVFASFNNVQKVSGATVAAWAEILRRVPGATLSLKSSWLSRPRATAHFREAFARHGVAAERLALSGWIDGTAAHLAAYGSVDVALDPFPYSGTTTTLEALWMGVPVVTLMGDRHAGRVGASLLHRIGAAELVAKSVVGYVDEAVALATDEARLIAYRAALRDRLAASPLLDAAGFARALEAAYREMWQRWCDSAI